MLRFLNNAMLYILCLYIICLNIIIGIAQFHKHEYKNSFSRPLLLGPDQKLFLWDVGGNAVVSSDHSRLRLVSSLNGQKGFAWNKVLWNHPNFEIVISIGIAGHGKLGADGLAIWYTETKGALGSTFGNVDKWNGLGVFLDSYDNDHAQNNPHIGVMINDGSKVFDQSTDGREQILGGCVAHFRNQVYPTYVKITYFEKMLNVSYAIGPKFEDLFFTPCYIGRDIILPPTGYFGLSAATGGLADDHDVFSFMSYTLTTEPSSPPPVKPVSQMDPKHDDQYKEFYKKLQEEKDHYHKEHKHEEVVEEPEHVEHEEDWMDTFEGKELRLILEGQNRIENTLGQIASTVNRVFAESLNPSQVQPGTGQANLLPHVQEQTKHLLELKNLFEGVSKQISSIKHSPQPYADQELKEQINHLKEAVFHSMKKSRECPHLPKCVTPFLLVIFMVLQVSLFAGYIIYKSNQEQKSKKLF